MLTRIKSAVPLFEWLPQYRLPMLRGDLVAGVTLAAYAVPVSIAYAALAGLPSQAGLYCYLLGGVAYCVFGSSRQLAIGPTSAISILIGASLAGMSNGDPVRLATLAMHTAILTGLIGVVAWACRLGNVVNFVSETTLSGFRVGAGLVIASTQLPKLFAISSGGENFFTRVFNLSLKLGDTSLPSLAVGVAALVLLFGGDRLFPKRPVALVVVALSIVFMSSFPGIAGQIKTVGQITGGFPHLAWPLMRWSEIDDLLVVAMACFLLAYVEGISVARTFSLKHRYSIDADQELLALGAANLVAGLGQAYPLAGGMSQSAVNDKAGAHTPLAVAFASAAISAVLLFLTGVLEALPQPVLAAIVLFAIRGLIKLDELKHLRRVSPFEFSIAMVAMAGVLLFGILKGVLLSVLFSILLLLKRASRPRLATLGRLPGSDRFVDARRYADQQPVPGMILLRIESGLFYFNALNVKCTILDHARKTKGTRAVVLDLSTSANIDLAGARMLSDLHEELGNDGIALMLAEVHGYVRDILRAENLQGNIVGIEKRMAVAQLVDSSTLAATAD